MNPRLVNGNYHFTRGRSRLQPFVSGGFTLLTDSRHALPAFNVGGGVTIWTKRRVGIRVDVRDEIDSGYGRSHIPGIRVGMVIRLGRHTI